MTEHITIGIKAPKPFRDARLVIRRGWWVQLEAKSGRVRFGKRVYADEATSGIAIARLLADGVGELPRWKRGDLVPGLRFSDPRYANRET